MKIRDLLVETYNDHNIPYGPKISVKKQKNIYVAIDFNTYNGASDDNKPVYGKGKTKMQAVFDLVDQLKKIEKYDERILRRAEERYLQSLEFRDSNRKL